MPEDLDRDYQEWQETLKAAALLLELGPAEFIKRMYQRE